MIREYFCEVEKKLEEIAWLIKKKNIEFNLVSEEMGIIKGKIVFVNSNVLDFRELVSAEHTDYRFQLMNGNNRLIYRWDSERTSSQRDYVFSIPFAHSGRR